MYAVTHDKRTVAGPFAEENDAFGWLLRHQGQSVDYATTYGGYAIIEITPWSAQEAHQHRSSALHEMRGDRDHRTGHRGDTGESLHLTRENCAACVLAGYGSDTDESPNYGAWARIYVESGTPIPARYRAAFERNQHDENAAYAVALARSIATFGVRFGAE